MNKHILKKKPSTPPATKQQSQKPKSLKKKTKTLKKTLKITKRHGSHSAHSDDHSHSQVAVTPKTNPRLKLTTIETSEYCAPQAHTNHYGQDRFYNPEEDSDFEPHYTAPPSNVAAFPFADKPFKFSIRFAQDPNKVHNLNIYEGETYWDAVHRQSLHFPDAQCTLPSTFMQETQFFDGASGCGGCIGQFPIALKNKLPQLSSNETETMRNFWEYRVHQEKTSRDGGHADSVRFLCTLDFTPDMDGVEIFAAGTNHPHFDNVDYIRAGDAAMI